MPDPKNILSFKPPGELEKRIDEQCPDELNVYIDFKNIATALYVEDVAKDIVFNSTGTKFLDSTIFQAVLYTISWWKKYSKERGLKCNLYFFSDFGKSAYHREIHTGYKENRAIANLKDPELYEDLFKIRMKNSELSEKVINKIPGCHFFYLSYLESDFVPYYLITRKITNKNAINVICSNDKDMFQILEEDNIVQIYTMRGNRHLVDKDNCLISYTKLSKSSEKIQQDLIYQISKLEIADIPMVMALVGDKSDDIPGVKGIGPKNAVRMISESDTVEKTIGSGLIDRVASGGNVFIDTDPEHATSKKWEAALESNETVTKAYKMISYECLSRWLELKNSIEKINWIKYMDDILNKKDDINKNSFIDALSKLDDIYLELEDVENIFI